MPMRWGAIEGGSLGVGGGSGGGGGAGDVASSNPVVSWGGTGGKPAAAEGTALLGVRPVK